MGYGDWTINGISPKYYDSKGVDWTAYPTITIHCNAHPDELNVARDEIESFREISCSQINNKPLLNGGTDLQVSMDGQIVPITEGDSSWNGAIEYPKFVEDEFRNDIIQWDIVIHLQITNLPSDAIYTPDYRLYPNIDYTCWTETDPSLVGGSVTKLPSTVATAVVATTGLDWTSPNNIKTIVPSPGDADMARVYNSTATVADSYWLKASNFGFNINNSLYDISEVHVRLRYANSSTGSLKQYLRVMGSDFPTPHTISQNIVTSNPDNIQDMALDSLPGAKPEGWSSPSSYHLKSFTLLDPYSTTPSTYNSSGFMVSYHSQIAAYKHLWCDYIQVTLYYVPKGVDWSLDPDAEGYEIGNMTITEDRAVKSVEVYGSACNLPASLTVNGVTQNWSVSHDHNVGESGGVEGLQYLTFTISPPATVLTFESTTHKPPTIEGDPASDNEGSRINQIKVVYA